MNKQQKGHLMKQKLNLTTEQFDTWLDALRSGDFKQGQRKLKDVSDGVTSHCCLGVLCETNNLHEINGRFHSQEKGGVFSHDKNTSSSYYYPTPLYRDSFDVEQYNLTFNMPDFPNIAEKYHIFYAHTDAAELNDDYAVSFEDLASMIETSYEAGL